MKLNEKSLAKGAAWREAGFKIPEYNRASVCAATRKAQMWVHFGAGNLFRAFLAPCHQQLLDAGLTDRGITVADNADMVGKIFHAHDELSLAVSLCPDGTIEKEVVGSIAEAVCLREDAVRLKEIFCQPSLQMVSFTITEKGYRLLDMSGKYTEDVAHDRMVGPEFCVSYMGRIAALLHARYTAGAFPIAMVSMDNCSHNGDRLKASLLDFAQAWHEKGLCAEGFLDYMSNPARVAFPWSMIDKITPRPDATVREMLQACGFEDVEDIVTCRGTYVAPFVNAEKCQYLVIEDTFPNGRPPLEKAGIYFTDRETVKRAERMKVCTCLNPLHTALAIFGCLLGFNKINEEMKDADLVAMIRRIGYVEGLPMVDDPGILSPKAFLDEVIEKRFPNPFLPDTPQRIACDTSQKIPVRFGETLKSYMIRGDMSHLKLIPFVFAGWCRYLMGVDDAGQPFEVSPDPMLDSLKKILGDVKLGDQPREGILEKIYSNAEIFGVDLYSTCLGKQVEADFWDMVQGPGMVRKCLQKKLAEL